MHSGFDRLPGPLRQQPRGDHALHGLMQRIVVPLRLAAVILRPGRADSASSTVVTIEAHSGVRSPDSTPAPSKVVSSLTERSSNLSSGPLSWVSGGTA